MTVAKGRRQVADRVAYEQRPKLHPAPKSGAKGGSAGLHARMAELRAKLLYRAGFPAEGSEEFSLRDEVDYEAPDVMDDSDLN